jgi:hypothetical protein
MQQYAAFWRQGYRAPYPNEKKPEVNTKQQQYRKGLQASIDSSPDCVLLLKTVEISLNLLFQNTKPGLCSTIMSKPPGETW